MSRNVPRGHLPGAISIPHQQQHLQHQQLQHLQHKQQLHRHEQQLLHQ
jgi:3-mercaptopyruvate sulfurtransferase SseA